MEAKTYKSDFPEITIKYKPGNLKKTKIKSSKDIFELLKDIFNADTIEYSEEVLVIYLDRGSKTIGWYKHSSGGMIQSVVDIKMILNVAIKCCADSIIISHNHPSSMVVTSPSDDAITKKLKAACDIMEIRLLDHVVMAGNKEAYYSYSDEGRL